MSQADVRHQIEVVGDDRDLAARLEADVSLGIHLGDLRVGRVVVADRRDVASGPVGVADLGDELLRRRGCHQHPALGEDLELHGGGAAGIVLRPFGDPVVQEFVGLRVPRHPQPTLVGHLAQGLAEHQAGPGGHRIDPPPAGLAREDGEVLVGEITPETQPEAPLAGRRAVTRTHVATRLAERGDHVVPEAHRGGPFHPLDGQRRFHLSGGAQPRDHARRPIAERDQFPPLRRDGRDPGIADHPFHRPGCIADRTIGPAMGGDHLLGGASSAQLDGRRRNLDVARGGIGRSRRCDSRRDAEQPDDGQAEYDEQTVVRFPRGRGLLAWVTPPTSSESPVMGISSFGLSVWTPLLLLRSGSS